MGAAIVAYVVLGEHVDFAKLALAFDGGTGLILIGFAVLLVVPIGTWLRWFIVVPAQGIRIGAHDAFAITMIGVFFNAFLLGSMGGDALKAYYVAAGAGSRKKATAVTTVFLDRAFGALAQITIVWAALAISWRTFPWSAEFKAIAGILAAATAAVITIFVLLLIPRLRERRRRRFERYRGRNTFGGKLAKVLDDADAAVQVAREHPGVSLACFSISMVNQLATVAAFNCFAVALGVTGVPFVHYAALAPLAVLGAGAPLPGGGIGFGELFSSVIFRSGLNVAKWTGGTILLLWRVGQFVLGPVGFVYYLFYRKAVRRARDAARDSEADVE